MPDTSSQPKESGDALPKEWQKWKAPALNVDDDSPPPSISDRAFLDFTPAPLDAVAPVWEFPTSDDGRATFFLQHFGGIVRYVPELKLWRVWHGHRWHDDFTGRLGHYCQILSRWELLAAEKLLEEMSTALAETAKATVKATAKKEKKKADDEDDELSPKGIQKRYQWARRQAEALGDEKTISALLAAAARIGKIIVPLQQWDANPLLVGTLNGVLNLKTSKHRDGGRLDYITKEIAVQFDAAAQCPHWRKFIARILPIELAKYVQRLAGYSLTGGTDDQAFYFLYGVGKNGKSVFIRALAALFHHYAGKAPAEMIEEPRNGAPCKHNLAQLPGIRFLYGEETTEGGKLRENLIKSLTAGDPITGEAKYAAPFIFSPVAKLWLMGNHRPRVHGTDAGIWRRVRLIPFTECITEDEDIPASVLLSRFEDERPGILNWMLEGLTANKPGAVPMPQVVKAAVAEYRESEDDLAEFITDCTQDAAENYREPKGTVFQAYRKWAAQNGITFPLNAKQFTRRVGEREGWKLDAGRRHWMQKSIVGDYLPNS